MKNTFGNNVSVTLFGESHGPYIGAVLDGLTPGIRIDDDYIRSRLSLRRPSGEISTPRAEADEFTIVSGVFEGMTTGAPLCILIPNADTRSGDYSENYGKARPGHADYTAYIRYDGKNDYRGGGHFSGRLTAALVAAGAVAQLCLKARGIRVVTHISAIGGIYDREISGEKDLETLESIPFAVLDAQAAADMNRAITDAKSDGDSVGGILETVITGVPAGVGEPWFDSVESMLSHIIFSVPAVKGVEFGRGFALAGMRGSTANDVMRVENGKVVTLTNNNGGINGGITNGMPIIVRTAVKPTPTIHKAQETVDYINMENTVITGNGRHDPCIVHRARAVLDAVCALAVYDMTEEKR